LAQHSGYFADRAGHLSEVVCFLDARAEAGPKIQMAIAATDRTA
jgi:hypothetical protein